LLWCEWYDGLEWLFDFGDFGDFDFGDFDFGLFDFGVL